MRDSHTLCEQTSLPKVHSFTSEEITNADNSKTVSITEYDVYTNSVNITLHTMFIEKVSIQF